MFPAGGAGGGGGGGGPPGPPTHPSVNLQNQFPGMPLVPPPFPGTAPTHGGGHHPRSNPIANVNISTGQVGHPMTVFNRHHIIALYFPQAHLLEQCYYNPNKTMLQCLNWAIDEWLQIQDLVPCAPIMRNQTLSGARGARLMSHVTMFGNGSLAMLLFQAFLGPRYKFPAGTQGSIVAFQGQDVFTKFFMPAVLMFVQHLNYSHPGYAYIIQVKEVLECDLRGWMSTLKRRAKDNGIFSDQGIMQHGSDVGRRPGDNALCKGVWFPCGLMLMKMDMQFCNNINRDKTFLTDVEANPAVYQCYLSVACEHYL